jgi:hypothetical protein
MQASKYFSQLQLRERQSTTATYKPNKSEVKQATGSAVIDWHADRKTEQE